MPWYGMNHGRRDRGSVKGKGRDERNSVTAQGRSHRSRTVREVGWKGQEKMCAVVWGAPGQEGQRECEGERKGWSHRSRTVREVGWEGEKM